MSTLTRGGTALLVIDMQVDVITECGTHAQAVVDRTHELVQRARAADVPVVWVQHEDEAMPRGSDLWQMQPPLAPVEGEARIYKEYRDGFVGTGLDGTLAALGVDHLVVAGTQTDFCVRTTMARAAAEGYDLTLAEDCHTTCDTTDGGQSITAAQVVAHTNLTLRTLRYPGQTFAVMPAADLW